MLAIEPSAFCSDIRMYGDRLLVLTDSSRAILLRLEGLLNLLIRTTSEKYMLPYYTRLFGIILPLLDEECKWYVLNCTTSSQGRCSMNVRVIRRDRDYTQPLSKFFIEVCDHYRSPGTLVPRSFWLYDFMCACTRFRVA